MEPSGALQISKAFFVVSGLHKSIGLLSAAGLLVRADYDD
jgi:hypothetical protein